jgi:hypothetical protein
MSTQDACNESPPRGPSVSLTLFPDRQFQPRPRRTPIRGRPVSEGHEPTKSGRYVIICSRTLCVDQQQKCVLM